MPHTVPHTVAPDIKSMETTSTSLMCSRTLAGTSRVVFGQRLALLLAFVIMLFLAAPVAKAQSKSDLKGLGTVQFSISGVSKFEVTGTESHLNQFTSKGELHFTPGSKPDGALNGSGVIVMHAANGDQLVGTVLLITDASGNGNIGFAWRDSVRLNDGTTAYSTGQFHKSLPDNMLKIVKAKHGLVVIAIIAILIG